MKPTTAAIFLYASVSLAALQDTILPSKPPTITSEPWQCTTEILPQYFDPPKPTGALLTAIQSYGDVLQKDCKPTQTDIYGLPECTFPASSLWCRFSTAAPSSLLSSYSSYGSAASSWWSAKSSAAVSLARSCPIGWYRAMYDTPGGPGWLNSTLVFAGCYEEAHPTTGSSTKATATATTGSKAISSGPQQTATSTSTSKSNSVVGRAEHVEMWVVAGTGLAVTTVNSML
ncbi:hypothetical protein N5P37_008944 [Trichoderma harzianum]|jgi:hypothetical protein|uniref:DUF7735 domain-containing protein n=1 Tax=Trichoderma harzianum CBS 226.95 TaxID=983964 RepID=A0A2T4A6K0_TRIHA|nr:hypothetical protein M431DRAFT_89663 [Trichoderma harzianum CBS 226.95]KAK0758545.1 hypothetical protein N5P37_008944 [Trichoderma harzianum]PTB52690.1 hypothetical protein M431DRAFT_89663 [Trichoderma harzianum CBS 226.95]